MIYIENLSGRRVCIVYPSEFDTTYNDIVKYIPRQYPEFNQDNYIEYTLYVKTFITLFNKGKIINFDGEISFDEDDSILQIVIKYEYLCYNGDAGCLVNIPNNYLKNRIISLIKKNGNFIGLLNIEEQT